MSVISAMVNVEFFRPKSEADDRILTLSLDGNQLCEAMEVSSSANVNMSEWTGWP